MDTGIIINSLQKTESPLNSLYLRQGNLFLFRRVILTNAVRLRSGVQAFQAVQAVNSAVEHALDVHDRSLVRLSAAENPGTARNEENDTKGDNAVVHVGRGDGKFRREHEQDGGQDSPKDSNLSMRVSIFGLYICNGCAEKNLQCS